MIARDQEQTTQRVKVGMIGLAAVLLLIGLAAAVFSIASRDRAVAGGAHPDVVANLLATNLTAPRDAPTNEPLAEMGVAPSASSDTVSNSASRPPRPSR